MKTKALELRDKGTFIPLLAIEMRPKIPDAEGGWLEQHWLLRRAGYDCERPLIMITHMHGGHKAHYDPYSWNDRTYHVAHDFIEKNWAELKDGDVIDVEFILGESKTPKVSEKLDSF